MRLIDADALKAYLQENYIIYDHSLEDIDAQPTIDVEPRKTGYWIECENENGIYFHKCSECGQRDMYQGSFAEWGVRGFSFYFKRRYCPFCGAKLHEVDDEISNIAKESADKISKSLEKVRAKGMQNQNIKEDEE